MPRAYRPRYATTARAAKAARAVGATDWHTYRPGPFRSGPITLYLVMPDDSRITAALADVEDMIAKEPI